MRFDILFYFDNENIPNRFFCFFLLFVLDEAAAVGGGGGRDCEELGAAYFVLKSS